MLTEKRLAKIEKEAGESMVQDGNLDVNIAANELRMAANKMRVLLANPNFRPVQEKYEFLFPDIARAAKIFHKLISQSF